MIDEQWTECRDEIVGLWGAGHRDVMDRRLDVWAKRFRTEKHAVVMGAIKKLEHTAKHWPSIADMHAAIDETKARFARSVAVPEKPGTAPAALGAKECTQLAGELVGAARERVRSGRGVDGDPWHRYLLELAEFYERNADRIRAGERVVWPPPLASEVPMARALRRAVVADPEADRAEHRRRTEHLPPADEEGRRHPQFTDTGSWDEPGPHDAWESEAPHDG